MGELEPRPIDRRIVGWGTSAFMGGRAEARIVRAIVPVVVCDAVSMYSLVNANLGTWSLLTADHLEVADVTEEVRATLAAPDLLERCLTRPFWRETLGVTLVELENPDAIVVPIRAAYDPASPDPGIGLNMLSYAGRLWYMLPDVVGSALLGRVPPVRRALRLVGVGRQAGLRPVRLRGERLIDPELDDPFVAMIEERYRVKGALPPGVERERREHFLKITASATGYGTYARFDRRELPSEVPILVYGPDDTPIPRRTAHPEDPGPYTFPPVAAAITAGARLMLILLERLVTDAGGTYTFCDTDSMAIVAMPRGGRVACVTEAGDAVPALSHDAFRAVLDRFRSLNPFDRTLVPGVWKVEHESLDRELFCFAVSAKRYALLRLAGPDPELVQVVDTQSDQADAPENELSLTDWSEHGLGQYVDPIGRHAGRANRTADGRPTWVVEAWDFILRRAIGQDPALPDWVDRYALAQFSVASPLVATWFAGRDRDLPWGEKMRPGAFGLLAQPAPLLGALPGRRLPAAPYEEDPDRWPDLEWYDRATGDRIRVNSVDPVSDPIGFARALERGDVPIRTLRDVLLGYDRRPEHKSLGPDGRPAGPTTAGLLRRRWVRSEPALTMLAGKEGNKLLARLTGETTDPADYRLSLGIREEQWPTLVAPVLRRVGIPELVRRRLGSRRALERAVLGTEPAVPHGERRERLTATAVDFASAEMRRRGLPLADDGVARLADYRRAVAPEPRLCACGCGRSLSSARQKWATDACRKRGRAGASR